MANERHYCVYKHTTPSGKVYIGMTGQPPERRWRNGEGYKYNSYFYRAIKKYDWNNIEHLIVKDNLTKLEAENLEIELIAKYNAFNSKYGYNFTTGGECCTHTEHSRKKLSLSRTGMKASPELRKKFSQMRKGKNNPFYNKTHTDEVKAIISKIHKGVSLSEEHKRKLSENSFYKGKYGKEHNRSLSVICVETDTIYYSMREAERILNIDHVMISRCCNGKQHTAGGYHWKRI